MALIGPTDRNISMVVITGGPCGGKTTFLEQARAYIEQFGMHVFVVEESATKLINDGFSPRTIERRAFQRQVLRTTLAAENAAYARAMASLKPGQQCVLLCDRGVLDSFAYIDQREFVEILAERGYSIADFWARYRAVVHLVTAADGAEEHYTLANNAARTETLEEARALDLRTQRAWLGHPHHFIIDNSTDMADKTVRALKAMRRVLNMRKSREIERVFLFRSFDPKVDLPTDFERSFIAQTYLRSEDPTVERRVRVEDAHGKAVYHYCEKRGSKTAGVREQNEREITGEECRKYLQDEKEIPPAFIQKFRRRFPYKGNIFELDHLVAPVRDIFLLECELHSLEQPIAFMSQWGFESGRLVEVTRDPLFSMYAVAHGSLKGFDPATYEAVAA